MQCTEFHDRKQIFSYGIFEEGEQWIRTPTWKNVLTYFPWMLDSVPFRKVRQDFTDSSYFICRRFQLDFAKIKDYVDDSCTITLPQMNLTKCWNLASIMHFKNWIFKHPSKKRLKFYPLAISASVHCSQARGLQRQVELEERGGVRDPQLDVFPGFPSEALRVRWAVSEAKSTHRPLSKDQHIQM